MKILVTGEHTQGRLALIETVITPAQEPPLHAHTHEDEVVYVVRGAVTFYIDGVERPCRAGEAVFLPRGHDHTWRVDSGEASLLVVVLPAGFEDVFDELDALVPSSHAVERMIAIAARYGVEIKGPGPVRDALPASPA